MRETPCPVLAVGESLFPERDDRALLEAQVRIGTLTARIEGTARKVPTAVCRARDEVRAMVASYQV